MAKMVKGNPSKANSHKTKKRTGVKNNDYIRILPVDLRKQMKRLAIEQNYLTQLCYLLALKDGEGFGTLRLNRTIIKANKYLNEIDTGRLKADDIVNILGVENQLYLHQEVVI